MAETNIAVSSQRIKEDTAGMWQDFYNELSPFGKVCGYSNDFLSWVPDEWTVTEATAGTQLLEDARNGILILTAGAGENQGNNLQLGGSGDGETVGESFAPVTGKNLWFECRVASNDADQNDFFVGLHNEDTSVIAGRGTDYIGFYTLDGSANLNVQSAATSVVSSETAVATVADGTYLKLGFKVTGASKVDFYVNDVLEASITTNIPTALMKLTIAHLSGEGVANTLSIDYVACYQDR
jgi:hypothetical protein